jgi:hypothetical protein
LISNQIVKPKPDRKESEMESREKGEPYAQWVNLDPQKIQKQITKWKFTYIAHCNEPLGKEENNS